MSIRDNILSIRDEISDEVKLVAVSKTRSIDEIKEAYNSNQKIFEKTEFKKLLKNSNYYQMISSAHDRTLKK